MLDVEGRVQTWNAGAEAIKGYRREEIVGKTLDVFYTPEDAARGLPRRLLAQAASEGRVENEGWRVRKDGTRFWADVVITALRGPQGQLAGYAKVTRDLTERRKGEEESQRRNEELAHLEERFRLLVDAVEDYAIFMLDPTGRVATWNIGAQRTKGYTAAEIIGQHFSRFRTEEDVRTGRCEQELAIAIRDGKLEEEGWRVRKDGSAFWASVVLKAVHGSTGQLIGFAQVTRDLTERLRLEDERLRRGQAEESARLRNEFLMIASHELRTPLTTLQIELAALGEAMAGGDARVTKRLGRAARNADRLGALIESLLDVSRIASGRLSLKLERLELAHTLSELVDGMRDAAARAGCAISFQSDGPIHGSWDRLRVEQVVMNLVSNAIKYGAGSPIVVTAWADADDVVIEVADRGPGVPAEDLARIFERFERAASLRHYGGLGLGLYLSRQIVEAQGGTISARNRREGGTCFTVRLPREAADLAALTAGMAG
jgi:PAS domain S-box-containing protein